MPITEEQRKAILKTGGNPSFSFAPSPDPVDMPMPELTRPEPFEPLMPKPEPVVPAPKSQYPQQYAAAMAKLNGVPTSGEPLGAPPPGLYRPGEVIVPARRQVIGGTTTSISGASKPAGFDERIQEADKLHAEAAKTTAEALDKEAIANADKAKAELAATTAYATQVADIQKKQDAENAAIYNQIQERQASIKDINPDNFWQSKGVGNQIASAIAVGLGAFGAALSKTPNYALQIIDGAINRDIAAQEQNINKKFKEVEGFRNQLRDNYLRFGDMKAAQLITKNQMLEAAKLTADQQMAGVNNAKAKAALDSMKSQWEVEQNKNALHATEILSGKTQSSSQWGMTQPIVAGAEGTEEGKPIPEEMRKLMINLGGGRVALYRGEPKGAEQLRADISSGVTINDQLQKLIDLRKEGSSLKGTDLKNKLTAIKNILMPLINVRVKQGAMAAGEREGLEEMLSSPAGFFDAGVEPALQSLQNVFTEQTYNQVRGAVDPLPEGYAIPKDVFEPIYVGKPAEEAKSK